MTEIPPLIFEQLKVGNMENFCYILINKEEGIAAIIDPGFDPGKIIDVIEKHIDIKKLLILLTHTHYDHTGGIAEITKNFNTEVYVHSSGVKASKQGFVGISSLNCKREHIRILDTLKTIECGSKKIAVILTPGHSKDGVTYLVDGRLMTGDLLFIDAIGRTDLPGSNKTELFFSLQKLKALPGKVHIYPGHDYGDKPFDTIENQLKTNQFLACSSLNEFLKLC